jgi:hypothetical protein
MLVLLERLDRLGLGELVRRQLLETLAVAHPRASRYLAGEPAPTLRIVLNGSMLEPSENPIIQEADSLLLIQAVAGG